MRFQHYQHPPPPHNLLIENRLMLPVVHIKQAPWGPHEIFTHVNLPQSSGTAKYAIGRFARGECLDAQQGRQNHQAEPRGR
jgi:hypothetical protein